MERNLAVSSLRESDPPTKAPTWLVSSVRQYGVISSIIVADHGDAGYRVIDGRRRLAAARLLGLASIPARVFDGTEIGPMADELTVSLNALRAPNWPVAREAVLRMAAQSLDAQEIGRRTALSVPTCLALIETRELPPEIERAFAAGRIRLPALRKVAASNRKAKREVVRVLKSRGIVRARDTAELV